MIVRIAKPDMNCIPLPNAPNPPSRTKSISAQRDAARSAAEPLAGEQETAGVIIHRPVTDLKTNLRNPRTHDDKQIAQIAASIRQFGFTNPILIDGEGMLIAGHARLAAAHHLGLPKVPTITVSGLSD